MGTGWSSSSNSPMDCDEHFDLNEVRVNDVNSYEEMEHRDDEVFPNPSSSSYGQTVPAEATVLSTSTSHGQSSSMGHNVTTIMTYTITSQWRRSREETNHRQALW